MKIYDPLLLTNKFDDMPNDYLVHWCPGCKIVHPISIVKPNVLGAIWQWDGNADRPTFTPSFNLVGRCHYFITNGEIVYLSDSTHDLSGQTVELPDMPNWW